MPAEKGDRRDPARTLALLWRTPDGPDQARGRKHGLTADRVVAAGIELADRDGLAELSMRRVAEHLGVGTMSLYTYVPGRADLVAAMRDQVAGEIDVPDTAAGWRPALEHYARQLWQLYHRHPWLLLVPMANELVGPHETARMEGVLAVAGSAGLGERDMLGVFLTIDGCVRGAAALSVDAAQAADRSGVSEVEWWEERAPLVERFVTAARFPAMAAITAAGAFEGDYFEFGLARTIDGIAAHVTATHVTAAHDTEAGGR